MFPSPLRPALALCSLTLALAAPSQASCPPGSTHPGCPGQPANPIPLPTPGLETTRPAFPGNIGVTRIVALPDRHGWAPNLPGAIDTLRGWTAELPGALMTASAKKVAARRVLEMKGTLDSLAPYTFSGAAL